MALRAPRLPGVRFDASAASSGETLPRMDVACFVGFAASGPLDRPVAVEDVGHFEELFGGQLPLAWDAERGETVTALLAPTVRAFFRNGGRRCWVIRVADRPRANRFPLRGLGRVTFAHGSAKVLDRAPAFAVARSEGSWSDDFRVATALIARPLSVVALVDPVVPIVDLRLPPGEDVKVGDVLRLRFGDRTAVVFSVDGVATTEATSAPGSPPRSLGQDVRIHGSKAVWLRTLHSADLPTSSVVAVQRFHRGSPLPVGAMRRMEGDERTVALTVRASNDDAPEPGEAVRVECGRSVWLTVGRVVPSSAVGSPPGVGSPADGAVEIQGHAVEWLDGPTSPPSAIGPAELLTFEMRLRAGERALQRMSGLGFDRRHERYWGALPTDRDLCPIATFARPATSVPLWNAAAQPRFALAGRCDDDALTPGANSGDVLDVPFDMPFDPSSYLGPVTTGEIALRRDGLEQFGEQIFLDPALAGAATDVLIDEADFLRYRAEPRRPLRGLHAALEVPEATLIAIPDAAHRPWVRAIEIGPPPAGPSSPPVRPQWWHFLPCDRPASPPADATPRRDQFLPCDLEVLDAPVLGPAALLPGRRIRLQWRVTRSGIARVEEATRADWSDARAIHVGDDRRELVLRRGPGVYFYRARLEVGSNVSDWSAGASVRIATATGFEVVRAADASEVVLTAVHRALLRVCAARGDLLAVLSLPQHYRAPEAMAHAALLRRALRPGPDTTASVRSRLVPPFGGREIGALGYGALYHPWLVVQRDAASVGLEHIPPDGTIAGTMAARAITRGAWIAPANEPIQDVVGLEPDIALDQRLALDEARVNLVRQDPRGFLTLAADTLSLDEDVRPINVRRLLSLLRRLATRAGARYVFEPNGDAFRRLVQRRLDAVLRALFERGAFAGSTAATSFQVVADPSVNPPDGIERGRLVVELRVAPSLSAKFIAVRLVQSGDRLAVEES